MKTLLTIILSLILSIGAWGQKYSTLNIRTKADSLLKSYLGDSLFNSCTYDSNTYYVYRTIFGKTKWETLSTYKSPKGRFVSIDMRWHLFFNYPKCPSYSKIGGMVSFVLDSALHTAEKPY